MSVQYQSACIAPRSASRPVSIDTVSTPTRQDFWPHREAARRWLIASWQLNLAVCHLALAATLTAKLASDFQPCTGALYRQVTFYFCQAGHDVEKQRPKEVQVSMASVRLLAATASRPTGLGAHQPDRRLHLAAEQAGRAGQVPSTTNARGGLAGMPMSWRAIFPFS